MMPPSDWADKWKKGSGGRKVPESNNSKAGGGSGDVLLSVLRCMSNNPTIVKDAGFPIFEDKRGFKLTTMFRSSNVLQTLLKQLKDVFHKKQQEIRWPALLALGGGSRGGSKDMFNHYVPPIMIKYKSGLELLKADRTLVAPRVPNYLCDRKILTPIQFEGSTITQEDLIHFSNRPLEIILQAENGQESVTLDSYVIEKTRDDEQLPPLSTELPFNVDISKHPNSKSSVADAIISRLKEDVSNYATSENSAKDIRLVGGFSSLNECALMLKDANLASSKITFLSDLKKNINQSTRQRFYVYETSYAFLNAISESC